VVSGQLPVPSDEVAPATGESRDPMQEGFPGVHAYVGVLRLRGHPTCQSSGSEWSGGRSAQDDSARVVTLV